MIVINRRDINRENLFKAETRLQNLQVLGAGMFYARGYSSHIYSREEVKQELKNIRWKKRYLKKLIRG